MARRALARGRGARRHGRGGRGGHARRGPAARPSVPRLGRGDRAGPLPGPGGPGAVPAAGGGVHALIAATYVRVSTDEQAERGYSLAHQREECRRRAAALGAAEGREYADEGVSGAILDRPALTRLRAAVRARTVGLVVVYDPDRLARRLAHQLLITEEIEAAGARLEFVNFEWRHTPEGQLFYALRGAVAQYEKEKIRERTMAGRRQKAKAGRLPSGYRPYGYVYDPQGQTLAVDAAEAAVVRRIFGLLVEDGVGVNGIARRLTEEGVPTRRGAPAWHRAVVRRILGNAVYAGTFYANRMDCEGLALNRHLPPAERRAMRLRPAEEWIAVPVPAVVDGATWRRAQDVLAGARRLMHGHPRSDYLLSGLLRCGACGLPMCGTRRSRWGREVRGYTCRRHWSGARQEGCGRYVLAGPVEEGVWSAVVRWAGDAVRLAAPAAGERVPERGDPDRDALEGVEEALRSAEQGRRNVLAVLERHLADPQACMESLARIRARIGDLEARRRALRDRAGQADGAGAAPGAGRGADPVPGTGAADWLAGGGLAALPFAVRRLVVRLLVMGVAVEGDRLVVRARIPSSSARIRGGERDPDAPARDAAQP